LPKPPAPSSPTDDKANLRRTLLAARQALAADTAQRLSAQLGGQVARLLAERRAACVGFYWPMAGEFDARDALTAWLGGAPDRQAALPVVSHRGAPLTFHVWHPDAPMRVGRYNIPIPEHEHPVQPDLLLVPCVGFDAARLRLGYGGGYYDRTLAALQPRPYVAGVAFECGRVAALPREPHDVPLDVILTETGCY
jgi:5-formyltetrahydrofolate cyclo-ligase